MSTQMTLSTPNRVRTKLQLASSHVVCKSVLCKPLFRARTSMVVRAMSGAAGAINIGNGAAAGTVQPPAASPISVTVPPPPPTLLSPQANYDNIAQIGARKATLSSFKIFVLAIQAGVYVAFGAFFALSVGGALPGIMSSNPGLVRLLIGLMFPIGLTMITICGAELFTGNTAVVTTAVLEGQASVGNLARNLVISYLGNLTGSLAMAFLIGKTGLLATNTLLPGIAATKLSLGFGQAFARAIICNWFVCTSVWQAAASTTLPGKLLGLWAPVTAFVAIGLEHCIANMFFIPMAITVGVANVTWRAFIVNNLVPVTLGNIIGGAVCMAFLYSLSFGKLGKNL